MDAGRTREGFIAASVCRFHFVSGTLSLRRQRRQYCLRIQRSISAANSPGTCNPSAETGCCATHKKRNPNSRYHYRSKIVSHDFSHFCRDCEFQLYWSKSSM